MVASKVGANRKPRQKTGGRKKGTPNKITAALKDQILGALSAQGGQAYLEVQAKENPVAFMTLLGKVLPSEMKLGGPNGEPLQVAAPILNLTVKSK